MTEEEAKTKSCCGPMQAEHGKTHVVNCIGTACMAWRWEPDTRRGDGPVEERTLPRGGASKLVRRPGFVWVSGKSDGDVVPWGLFPRLGFCGLAGKP